MVRLSRRAVLGGIAAAPFAPGLARAARQPDMLRFGIVGAGLMPGDRRVADSLLPQDCLYTLVERSGAAERPKQVRAMCRVTRVTRRIRALRHPAAMREKFARVRIDQDETLARGIEGRERPDAFEDRCSRRRSWPGRFCLTTGKLRS